MLLKMVTNLRKYFLGKVGLASNLLEMNHKISFYNVIGGLSSTYFWPLLYIVGMVFCSKYNITLLGDHMSRYSSVSQ